MRIIVNLKEITLIVPLNQHNKLLPLGSERIKLK